jgi:competence protein ComEA
MIHIGSSFWRVAPKAAFILLCLASVLIGWNAVWIYSGALDTAIASPEQIQPELEPFADEQDEPERDVQPTDAPAQAVIYVTGAIVAPDVYQLPADARVKDLVLAAGGLTADADSEAVNLAAPLSDAQHIHIPRRGEGAQLPEGAGASGEQAEAGAPLNLNIASAADLDELPGVGLTIAERIVDYRKEHGPFQSVDDLANVKGIGASLLEKIAPLITVGP